jgi:hypothetical protein
VKVLITLRAFKCNSYVVIGLHDCVTDAVDNCISYVNSGDIGDNTSDDSLTMLPTILMTMIMT